MISHGQEAFAKAASGHPSCSQERSEKGGKAEVTGPKCKGVAMAGGEAGFGGGHGSFQVGARTWRGWLHLPPG